MAGWVPHCMRADWPGSIIQANCGCHTNREAKYICGLPGLKGRVQTDIPPISMADTMQLWFPSLAGGQNTCTSIQSYMWEVPTTISVGVSISWGPKQGCVLGSRHQYSFTYSCRGSLSIFATNPPTVCAVPTILTSAGKASELAKRRKDKSGCTYIAGDPLGYANNITVWANQHWPPNNGDGLRTCLCRSRNGGKLLEDQMDGSHQGSTKTTKLCNGDIPYFEHCLSNDNARLGQVRLTLRSNRLAEGLCFTLAQTCVYSSTCFVVTVCHRAGEIGCLWPVSTKLCCEENVSEHHKQWRSEKIPPLSHTWANRSMKYYITEKFHKV